MSIIKYLNQPFPKAENKWKVIVFISLFVSIFLIIFQPFGISLITEDTKNLFLSGYGIITFLILMLDLIFIEKLFHNFFNERNWTIWKEFTWLLWVIFSIGLGNAFYTAIILADSRPNIEIIVSFQIVTLAVAIIPITILIISKQKYLLHRNLSSANELNKSLSIEKPENTAKKVIKFYSDNEKDFIEFDQNNFLFIESCGNYVELYVLDTDKVVRKTFRSTLKRSLEFFTESSEVIQCHRAYIVNTCKILNAKGNSQGLRLSIENSDIEIPVSRGYVNSIKSLLSS